MATKFVTIRHPSVGRHAAATTRAPARPVPPPDLAHATPRTK